MKPGQVTAALQIGTAHARDFLRDGDLYTQQHLYLGVSIAPLRYVTVSYVHALAAHYDSGFAPATRDLFGSPRLSALVSFEPLNHWSIGLLEETRIPTLGASRIATQAISPAISLVTAVYGSGFRAVLNGGYRIDRTDQLFRDERDPFDRWVNGVAQENQVLASAAFDAELPLTGDVLLTPFLEGYGEFATNTAFAKNPIQASVGTNISFLSEPPVNLAVGARLRVSGGPDDQTALPALPPWVAFFRVAYEFPTAAVETTRVATTAPCEADTDCQSEQRCLAGSCVQVVEKPVERVVERVVEKVETVVKAPPTFVLVGKITDFRTKKPVPAARVTVTSDGGGVVTILADSNGTFTSFPLLAGEGLLPVTIGASGFQDQETAVPRGAANEKRELVVELRAEGLKVGILEGLIKNDEGEPLRKCTINLPALKRKLISDAQGAFRLQLPVGKHPIVVLCPGYIPQRRKIDFQKPGEAVIYNIDMHRRE